MAAVSLSPQGGRQHHASRRPFVVRNARILLAYGILVVLLALYYIQAPRFTKFEMRSIANQGLALTMVGWGQTIVILTGGIDLSVGSMVSLSNSIFASLGDKNDPTKSTLIGAAAALGAGILGGFINGAIIAYGRLQPIIVTLATGYIYGGIALRVRPRPGGVVDADTAKLFTGLYHDRIPRSLFLLLLFVILWMLFKRMRASNRIYAIGSSEGAAFMSGINVINAKILTYTLSGLSAAAAGLFFSFQTTTGNATTGAIYTLNSIAAVVLGGASLAGGRGSFYGTIAGAYALSIIPSVLLLNRVDPFYQSLLQGLILLGAVAFGALGVFRIRNRMERL